MDRCCGLLAATVLAAVPAAAQAVLSPNAELVSDERRRGLSWSGGKASAAATLGTDIGSVGLTAAATALRGAARHGGADAAFDLAGRWAHGSGPVRIDLGAIAHVFAGGAGARDYTEVQGGARALIGPLEMDVSASYAPRQAAIGGDNLYLATRARLALIGSPFTLSAGIGRSSGTVRDAARAERLRPGGEYLDWQFGLHHMRGRLSLGLTYTGTDIGNTPAGGPARHAGDTLVGRVALAL